MVRIWATFLVGALTLVLAFQNCGEQKAAQPAISSELDVEQPDTTAQGTEGDVEAETPAEDPAEDPATPPAASAQISDLRFNYSAQDMTYGSYIDFSTAEIKDMNDQVVRQLTNEELTAIGELIRSNQLVTGGSYNDAATCDPMARTIYGRLDLTDGQQFLLVSDGNDMIASCDQDFGNLGTLMRATVNLGGNDVTLLELLQGL